MSKTKTVLLMSAPPNDFQIKNVTLRISKKRNNDYKIQPIYTRNFIFTKKEYINSNYYYENYINCSTVITTNHQQSKSFLRE